MYNYINLVIGTWALFTVLGCGDKQYIKDDWPGINNFNIETENGVNIFNNDSSKSFNFNDKIILPKMGEDVSYKIISKCKRLSKNNIVTFVKKYGTDEKNRSSVDVIDHLASEILIYPERFKSCSFYIEAENQNNSKQGSYIEDLTLDQSDVSKYRIKIDLKSQKLLKEFQRSKRGRLALTLKQIENASFQTNNKEILSNPKLICHASKVSETPLKAFGMKILYGSDLILPNPEQNYLATNCILHASIGEGDRLGKTVTSDRFSFRNTSVLNNLSIHITETVNSNLIRQQPINYHHENKNKFNLITFKILNNSNENLKFKLNQIKSIIPISIIAGLESRAQLILRTKDLLTARFPLIYDLVNAEYSWTGDHLNPNTKIILVKPHSSSFITLTLNFNFLCKRIGTGKENIEIGFISAIHNDAPILNLKLINKNNFMTNEIISGNAAHTYAHSIAPIKSNIHNRVTDSKFPEHTLVYHFRNVAFSKRTIFSSKYHLKIPKKNRRQFLTSYLDQNGNIKKFDKYPFHTKINRNYHDQCTSLNIGD